MNARDEEFSELARPGPKSAAQTPAPPKERIKGSKENPEGTAATRSKAGDIEISEANEQALKDKIAEFIKDHPQRKVPSLGTLKKVFRRGAGAFSTSFRPTISGGQPNSRNAWAMARVNKFLKMAGGGEVKESYRKADGDLLEERFDCGTGAGGFKEGNTCAAGKGGEGATTPATLKDISYNQDKIRSTEEKIKKLQNDSKNVPERKSIDKYTGGDYRTINEYVRTGKFDKSLGTGSLSNEEISKASKEMDALIDRSKLPDGISLFHGVRDSKYINNVLNAKPGDIIVDKGFVSTSINPIVANEFTGVGKDFARPIIRIITQEGDKGFFNDFGAEYEVTLGRNQKLEVIKTEDIDLRGGMGKWTPEEAKSPYRGFLTKIITTKMLK